LHVKAAATNASFDIEVDPDQKISYIRYLLKRNHGLRNWGYNLRVEGEKEILQNKDTIYDAGLREGATLIVDYSNFDIRVRMGSKTITISVDPDNKVSTIKDELRKLDKSNSKKLDLNSTEEEEPELSYTLRIGRRVLKDEKSLYEEHIRRNQLIIADYNKINITVAINGKTIALEVDPDQRVSFIRHLLRKEGIKNNAYQLILGGKVVNEKLLIADADISEGSALVADYKDIKLRIRVGRKYITITVDPDNSVSTIKDAIKEIAGVDPGSYKLKLGAKVL
jgi:hypothetical protein